MSNHLTGKPRSHILRFAVLLPGLVIVVLVVFGLLARAENNRNLKEWTVKQAIATVSVVNPGMANEDGALNLPGRFEAYARAPIYSRVSGYLKYWKKDIGANVKAGELLAEIETPELDQQLLQARADLASTNANAELAGITAQRWQAMGKTNSVAKQEVDDKEGDYAIKQATVKAAEANLNRLIASKQFARIVSPFGGTITARNTDTGALINADGNNSGLALFEVSDVHKLRLYVNVPQNYSNSITPETEAIVTVPEQPGKTYTAKLKSSSGSINAATGSTLAQFELDNSGNQLLPGAYAMVRLKVPANANLMVLPASALIVDQKGLSVATVDQQNKVIIKTITVAQDLGKTILVSAGLNRQDRVVENPPDGIVNGVTVNIMQKNLVNNMSH